MVNGCEFLEKLETINGLEYDCEHPEYSSLFTCDNCPLGPKSAQPPNQPIEQPNDTSINLFVVCCLLAGRQTDP